MLLEDGSDSTGTILRRFLWGLNETMLTKNLPVEVMGNRIFFCVWKRCYECFHKTWLFSELWIITLTTFFYEPKLANVYTLFPLPFLGAKDWTQLPWWTKMNLKMAILFGLDWLLIFIWEFSVEFRKCFYHPYLRQLSEPLWAGGRQVLAAVLTAEHAFLRPSSGPRQVLGADLRTEEI